MGVGVTHASFGREVQSELPQVRFVWFFGLAPSAQPEEPEGEQARHLVETLGGAHEVGVEGVSPALRPRGPARLTLLHTDYLPGPESGCRVPPPEAKVVGVGRRSGFVYLWRAAASACGRADELKHSRGDANDVDR
jgi:hypothetical protein